MQSIRLRLPFPWAIDISNFEFCDTENIIRHAAIKLHVNQIRVHIGHTPKENIAYCQRNGIMVMAFSPTPLAI